MSHRLNSASGNGDEPPILRLFSAPAHLDSSQSLGEFFERWFCPEILVRERGVEEGTIRMYREALAWWQKLTDDPPLAGISRETLKEFRDQLRVARYARGKLRSAKTYPLSPARQNVLLTAIRTIVFHTGPDVDPKRETAGIVDRAPHIPVPKLDPKPKPSLTLKRAQKIAAAAWSMRLPKIDGIAPGPWCYALLCSWCFTGLRRDDGVGLLREFMQEREDGPWLVVPGEHIDKTGKWEHIAVHPELAEAWQAIATDSPYLLSIDRYRSRGKQRMLTGERCAELFEVMQSLAGIPEAQWVSPQVWRRTHIDWLAETGYELGRSLAQSAASHGSADTTEGHYVDLKNKYRVRMPWLCPDRKHAKPKFDARQRALFD